MVIAEEETAPVGQVYPRHEYDNPFVTNYLCRSRNVSPYEHLTREKSESATRNVEVGVKACAFARQNARPAGTAGVSSTAGQCSCQ